MRQDFSFSFTDAVIAEVGGVTLHQLHFDAKAVLKAYEKLKPLAERLGVELPKPALAAFCYTHLASLGAKIVFPENSEPKPFPIISSPEDIDKLAEPDNYLCSPVIQKKLTALEEIKSHFPDAAVSIGHSLEGPITTAMLLMDSKFLTLPYDDPKRAHRLLEFCTRSALNYANSITEYLGIHLQKNNFPDDFAGMFPPTVFKEFVVPYWEKTFNGLKAIERSLHSELLRTEHLPFLKILNIKFYDPGANQYLTHFLLRKHCPCKFRGRILAWHIHNLSSEELEKMYRKISQYKPYLIQFRMHRLEDEPKIKKLLEVARRHG